MVLEKVVNEKEVTITNRGMITIPAAFRKSYNLKDGDKVLIIEDEGTLKIIPIKDPETLRLKSYSTEEMKKEMDKSRKEELEREL
ncbi:MAG: AbrB/MazE/SpoVT family DNA-binding domain-containing protein [Candidatus Lokiarchaeota archaeon]|nr:AbrB/MazE/SpoVT family DNA-binding domain-containing protein [Candidatus Lokiarchaeota archaeon]